MKKNHRHFYHKIVDVQSIIVELDTLGLSDSEKVHLAELVDSNIHHSILDAILSELSEEDKKLFIEHFSNSEHDDIWKFLNERVDNIEEKIKKTASDLKKEMHQDIAEAKRRKPNHD